MKFVDEVKITVEAGAGGNGCISFRREKFVPRGGPDGGDGGRGGSVYLIGDRNLQTLYDLQLRPHYRAERGVHGKGKGMDGRYGVDVRIKVPLGVAVFDDQCLMGELLLPGETLLVAAGGHGGRGNRHFATADRQAPRHAEKGGTGEKRTLRIVLKLISDAGIVGLPNAGKSTLLGAITNAQPRIADYPFTTLTPNLGVVQRGLKNIILADMPGIIADAHAGKGLGIRFLRHIERTNLLIILIDVSRPDPMEQYRIILNEFRLYQKELLKKPRIVVFNKIDLLEKTPKFELTERTFYISALQAKGIRNLIAYLTHEDILKN
jgi:GTP-binding protein